ncbi:MAG: prkC 34 [Verrucomicrobiaceae bacterium]|nr:prkC 34 [Verrucomicrobiaceae bacterium]
MVTCGRCQFHFSALRVPGGHCPRCLLMGMDDESLHGAPAENDGSDTGPLPADDELAAELPAFGLEEKIGRGGMGVVWRARERVLDRHVAIKLLHNQNSETAFVERFTREARVLARLHHPNIITMFSFGRTRSNHCYLVMEMVEGTDLAKLLAQGPIEVPLALQIMTEVCAALQYAHEQGFVHRDVKPGNVLINLAGRVKVADFGLARVANDSDTLAITKHGWAVGTPLYTAPEQADGKNTADHRADIYSAGVVLYQMLTGELPRGVFSAPSKKRRMDARLDKIVMQALQENKEKRYQTIAQFRADLARVRESVDPLLIAARKADHHSKRWRRRREVFLGLSVAGLLGVMSAWYTRPYVDHLASRLQPGSQAEAAGAMAGNFVPGMKVQKVIRLQPAALNSRARFGRVVSLWQDWLAVAAPEDRVAEGADGGSVFLYRHDKQGGWALQQRLSLPSLGPALHFGYQIALAEGCLAVGSLGSKASQAGRVDLYQLGEGDIWRAAGGPLKTPLEASHKFGASLSLNGPCLAVFDPGDKAEKIHLFKQGQSGAWDPQPVTMPAGAGTPSAVILDHNEMFVASYVMQGARRVAEKGCFLRAPLAGGGGLTIDASLAAAAQTAAGARCVATDGPLTVCGSTWFGNYGGPCAVLRRGTDGTYKHEGNLLPPADMKGAEFGQTLAVRGNWIAVSADTYVVDGTHRGAVCLFHREADGAWKYAGRLQASTGLNTSDFGNSIALGPDCIIVGAPDSGRLGESRTDAPGAIIVYQLTAELR